MNKENDYTVSNDEQRYILAMVRKSDNVVFMVTPNKKFYSIESAINKAQDLARVRSQDYRYVVLSCVAYCEVEPNVKTTIMN